MSAPNHCECDECTELREEVERLRAALDKIAKYSHLSCSALDGCQMECATARQALNPEEK